MIYQNSYGNHYEAIITGGEDAGGYVLPDGQHNFLADGEKTLMFKGLSDGRVLLKVFKVDTEGAEEVLIGEEPVDLDGLNYLAGKSMDFVNKNAMNGTILAHTDGNVPNLLVKIPRQDEYSLGQLFYFFEFACGVSGYILGVNPFNQPGVESYKKNMFALLGKPGYEKEREELLKRL